MLLISFVVHLNLLLVGILSEDLYCVPFSSLVIVQFEDIYVCKNCCVKI